MSKFLVEKAGDFSQREASPRKTTAMSFEQWVPFPLERVFLFFADPRNLPRLMPPS
jgi:hypothetical protein